MGGTLGREPRTYQPKKCIYCLFSTATETNFFNSEAQIAYANPTIEIMVKQI